MLLYSVHRHIGSRELHLVSKKKKIAKTETVTIPVRWAWFGDFTYWALQGAPFSYADIEKKNAIEGRKQRLKMLVVGILSEEPKKETKENKK